MQLQLRHGGVHARLIEVLREDPATVVHKGDHVAAQQVPSRTPLAWDVDLIDRQGIGAHVGENEGLEGTG